MKLQVILQHKTLTTMPLKHTTSVTQAELKLSVLTANTEEPFVFVDTDFRIVEFNKQFNAQYQRFYNREIIKGKSVLGYARDGNYEELHKIYSEVFNGKIYETEMAALLPDDSKEFFSMKFKPVYNDAGIVMGAFVTVKNISEEKRIIQQIIASENRFRALVENGAEIVCILNEAWRPVYVSSSVGKIIGYSEEEALKLDIFSNVHPDSIPEVQEILTRSMNAPGLPISGNRARVLLKDNSWRWFEYTVTNMFHNPAINGIIANLRDVTEKVKVEQEKEFDRNNYYALINNTKDLMWSISREGKLITSNIAFDEMVKHMSGHSVVKGGDAPTAGFSPEQLKRWEELYKRAFSGETFTIVEYTETPFEYWSEISFYPIFKNGEVVGTACYSRNITERKLFERTLEQNTLDLIKVKEDLERSEKSLKQAQEMAGLGSWSYNVNADFTEWSDQLYTLLGENKGEISPSMELFLNSIHPDDLKQVQDIIAEGEKTTRKYSFNCRIIRKDGMIRYVHSSCRFKLGPDALPLYVYGIVYDITDRKNSETKLLHSESRLKQAQAIAHVGSWEVNFAANRSMWSDEAYRIYGLEPGEHGLSFEQWRGFIHPEDLPGFELEMKRAQDTLTDSSYAHRIIRKDGAIRHVISESKFEFNAQGTPIGLYGIVKDVTEKKLVDEEIRIAKERYDLVTKATNDAIYDWDLETGEIVRTGDGLKILFGYNPAEVALDPKFWENSIHPEDRESSYGKLQRDLLDSTKEICDQEYRFRKADGTYAYVYDKGYIVRNNAGKAVRMIGATQDITHRKNTEIILKELNEKLEKRAEELAASNSELEQFAYIASHDLQEPLRMVTGFLTQLESKYKDQLDEKAKKYIFFATDGASRMRRIILDLLEYSRVGRKNNDKVNVNVNDILEEVVQLNGQIVREKNADILWQDLPTLKGSKTALQQVFHNLIGNALKYQMNNQKPVIEINTTETDSHWQFSVKDNGIGIEPQYFDKIFVVFQRLHNKDEFSGTGIGLAICKKIVENHNGKIWVESEYGKGSSFHFTIAKHLN
jgi:two-component system, chemotaxis family, CheB/CheR fusion protein